MNSLVTSLILFALGVNYLLTSKKNKNNILLALCLIALGIAILMEDFHHKNLIRK